MLSAIEARAQVHTARELRRSVALVFTYVPRVTAGGTDDERQRRAAEALARRKIRAEKDRFGPHPMWRRLTGFTFPVEATLSQRARKCGLKKLVKWLEKHWRGCQGAAGRFAAPCSAGPAARSNQTADCSLAPAGACDSPALREHAEARHFLITSPWETVAFKDWTSVAVAGRTVDSLCAQLDLSRAKLTTLTRELCDLTPQDIVDGFRLRCLKGALIDRLRTAARELWGAPGSFVHAKLEARLLELKADQPSLLRATDEKKRGTRGPAASAGRTGGGACATFVPDHWQRERACEISERADQLAAALHFSPLLRGRYRGGPENFDFDAWAVQLGFGTPARLRRACLNVFGRSLKQLERILANEVVRYYVAAEDKALRELARVKNNERITVLARDLYGCEDDPAEPPFLDAWSKCEYFDREWLDAMRAAYGGPPD